jgi:choline dehydrogenase
MAMAVPRSVDTLVLGGGTSGAVIAGRLVEASEESVLVAEAGPDYGAFGDEWPRDLVDARALANSHDWGYSSGALLKDRVVPFERARVIGGCSSHNGCAAIWGHRLDYDTWAEAGNDGWSTDDLLPFFQAANDRMRVRQPVVADATPFQHACLDAAAAAGIPLAGNLNDLDDPVGMALSPANIVDGVRWNSAFAYLDPVRGRRNLRIAGNHLADRLLIEHGRIVGARLIGPDGPVEVRASRTIVSAGTYGSPAILLRSGIGNPAELRAIGIAPVHDLPGVGRNLHDHPAISLEFAGTQTLVDRMTAFGAEHWMPEEQTIAKLRSARCTEAFDLHIYPVGGPAADTAAGWRWGFPVACMTPRSRGSLRLVSADPETAPTLDHNYLGDPDGYDRAVLADGIRIAREMTNQEPLRTLLGEEITDAAPLDEQAVAQFLTGTVAHYYHPVGTCKMGPARDHEAVVDPRGKIHGLDGGYVADCSIMPVIPRANTNIPAIVVGERIARWLAG